jgi:hypothetical protein
VGSNSDEFPDKKIGDRKIGDRSSMSYFSIPYFLSDGRNDDRRRMVPPTLRAPFKGRFRKALISRHRIRRLLF